MYSGYYCPTFQPTNHKDMRTLNLHKQNTYIQLQHFPALETWAALLSKNVCLPIPGSHNKKRICALLNQGLTTKNRK